MKKIVNMISMFGRTLGKNESNFEGSTRKRGGEFFAFLCIAISVLSFFSCEGQVKKPIKIDVTDKPNNNGVGLGVKKDTVFVTVHDTIYKNIPYEVRVEVPVEVIKEVEVIKTVEVPVEVIKEVIKEVPYEVIKTVEKGIEIDTLQTISDIVLLDFTDSGVQPSNKASVYAMIHGIGLAEIKMDTVHNWQRAYNLKRIKSYGTVSYESFGLPFQVRKIEPTIGQTTIKATTHFTEQCRVYLYLNNKLVTAISDTSTSPLSATKVSAIEYRHGRTFTGLTPNTEYEIFVEGVTSDGRKTFSETIKVKTLQ